MRLKLSLMALILVVVPIALQAQILVPDQGHGRPFRPRHHVPRPPVWSAYKIGSVDVLADVHDQAAKVRMSQVFENIGENTIETQFLFPIPEDAAISDLTLLYDGKELPGRLLDKDNAQKSTRKSSDASAIRLCSNTWGTDCFRPASSPFRHTPSERSKFAIPNCCIKAAA